MLEMAVPVNAPCSIDLKVLGRFTVVRLSQSSNAFTPTTLTPSLIVTFFKFGQILKASSLIASTPLGITTLLIPVFSKAFSPISVTDLGISITVSLSLNANAPLPIFLSPSGNETILKFLNSINASSPISFTFVPTITSST